MRSREEKCDLLDWTPSHAARCYISNTSVVLWTHYIISHNLLCINNTKLTLLQWPTKLFSSVDHILTAQITCNVWIQLAKVTNTKMSSLVPSFDMILSWKPAPCWQSWSPLSTPSIFCWYLVISVGYWTVISSWHLRQATSVFSYLLRLLMNWSVLGYFHCVATRQKQQL